MLNNDPTTMKQLKTISYVMSVITLAYFEYLWSAVFRSITTPYYRIDECLGAYSHVFHAQNYFSHLSLFSSESRMTKTKKSETISLFSVLNGYKKQ